MGEIGNGGRAKSRKLGGEVDGNFSQYLSTRFTYLPDETWRNGSERDEEKKNI